jgi:hypothetical protein
MKIDMTRTVCSLLSKKWTISPKPLFEEDKNVFDQQVLYHSFRFSDGQLTTLNRLNLTADVHRVINECREKYESSECNSLQNQIREIDKKIFDVSLPVSYYKNW